MSTYCRHEVKKQSPTHDEIKTQNDRHTHIIDSYTAPEKHFEPWNLSDPPKNRKSCPNTEIINEAPHFSRSYGWDEIEQNEDESKRLRQLLSIWDAERIAILKLQHDLDKNVFKRTFDYIKRIGQSIGLALWLWVHRPANCSNISSLDQYQQQQLLFPIKNMEMSQNSTCSPCADTLNSPLPEKNDDREKHEFLIPSIDTLPDSLWLKRFVLDEPQEYLPPIARAMKNMLDNDMFVWNSEIQEENAWPHFINQYRMTQNRAFLRNLYGNNEYQSSSVQKSSPSPKYTIGQKKSNMTVMNTDRSNTTTHQHSLKTANSLTQQKRIISSTHFTNSTSEQQQNIINFPRPIKSQFLLKPSKLSSKKQKSKNIKKKQKLKKKDRSKSTGQKSSSRSKSKRKKSRNRSKSKNKKSRSRSKSKTRKSSTPSESKRKKSRNRSKSKTKKSPSRSKLNGQKSSRRSKSKKKKKHITARTIK